MDYFKELFATLNEMSPYLILGFLISGLLHVYSPRTLHSKFLGKGGFRSVLGAAALGVPLPLCSCGVIPTSVSLKKEGASDGATVSFLVSTPQTGLDSILATYSLLGPAFAVIRPIAAFIVAVFSGVLVDKFGGKSVWTGRSSHECKCGCSHNHEHADGHKHDHEHKKSFWAALKYGYVDMMQDFGKWLVIGLLIAAAITSFVPDEVFAMFKEYYFLNILLILVISAPMYICATGSIPIALSLILKGISPGAAFVLLMAGPATNLASLIILNKEIGTRKTAIYLASIIVGAICFALFIDFALPSEWFSSLTPLSDCGHHHEAHEACNCNHGPIWWQTTTSIVFIILFSYAMITKAINKRKGHSCCSH